MNESFSEQRTAAEATQASGLSRFQGLSVFAAVALPMLAAYIVFYTGLGMPESTVNEGELLRPARSIEQLPLTGADGEPINLFAEKPKWRYLVLAGDDCANDCEKLLYTSRQVHIRLGDKAGRVERLLVTDRPLSAERSAQLREQHPRLRFAAADPVQIQQLLADTSHNTLHGTNALLVDQQGFAMMVYNNGHSGNQMLKDIKKLLKYSYDKK